MKKQRKKHCKNQKKKKQNKNSKVKNTGSYFIPENTNEEPSKKPKMIFN